MGFQTPKSAPVGPIHMCHAWSVQASSRQQQQTAGEEALGMTHLQKTTMDCSGADVTLAQWAVRGAGGKAKGQEEGRGAAQPPAVGSLPSLQGWGLFVAGGCRSVTWMLHQAPAARRFSAPKTKPKPKHKAKASHRSLLVVRTQCNPEGPDSLPPVPGRVCGWNDSVSGCWLRQCQQRKGSSVQVKCQSAQVAVVCEVGHTPGRECGMAFLLGLPLPRA